MIIFLPKANQTINNDAYHLLKVRQIREVKYPQWLANPIVVKNKSGKPKVCVDIANLNKACPKDYFPLPNIDMMVDAIS